MEENDASLFLSRDSSSVATLNSLCRKCHRSRLQRGEDQTWNWRYVPAAPADPSHIHSNSTPAPDLQNGGIKWRKPISTDREIRRQGAHPLLPLSRPGLDPIKLVYNKPVRQQYGNGADYYAELAVSSPVVSETSASIYCTKYSWRDGQAEWPVEYQDGIPTKDGHQSYY